MRATCHTFVLLILLTSCSSSLYQFHKKAIVVDTHNDVLSSATMKGLDITKDLKGKTHSDINRFKRGGVDVQVFSIFCDEKFGKDTAFKFANIEMDSLIAITGRNPGRLMLVKDPAGIEAAVKAGKLACMMGVEGGHMIEDKIENLEALYNKGARYMTLTWNNSNSWATSAADETTKKDSLPHKGLTAFGKRVVTRMNELGMLVDVSHIGEQTFWDVMKTTTKPVIASHSNAWSLCPVFRNLKDDQILAIGKNGGVIHLNFFSGFVDSTFNGKIRSFNMKHRNETDSLRKLKWQKDDIDDWMAAHYPAESNALRPPLSLLIDHLDHIVKLIGVDHVGLGSDFDGISSTPVGLDDVTTYPLITKALKERGYSKEDIKKILGGNFLRVFQQNQRTL